MRKLAFAAVLCAAIAVAPPAAFAADDSTHVGDCHMVASEDPLAGGGFHTGAVDIKTVVTAATPSDNPVSATVTCWVLVNGRMNPGAIVQASGTGTVVGGGIVSFIAVPGDVVELCTAVAFTSNSTPSWEACVVFTLVPTPPPPPGQITMPVVGLIEIQHLAGQEPVYRAFGALGDASLWSCSDNYPAVPYAVTCTPTTTSGFAWRCDVLLAMAWAMTPGAQVRASIDCDGGTAEVATGAAQGPNADIASAAPVVMATAFTCTADGGSLLPATPSYYVWCGDPGAPTIG